MSADKITVKEVIEQLQKMPQDMLVVGYGIDGFKKGEKLDGVEIYKHSVLEDSDGFIPIIGEEEDTVVVVISPIRRRSLINWCFET